MVCTACDGLLLKGWIRYKNKLTFLIKKESMLQFFNATVMNSGSEQVGRRITN